MRLGRCAQECACGRGSSAASRHWLAFLKVDRKGTSRSIATSALEVDDRAEEFYQGLMRYFASLPQPSSGIATYQKLRQLLSVDHGVALYPATETLVNKLLAQFGGSIADAGSPNL
jgi:hypothetical protein